MRLFIDECLSPSLATELNETGEHDARAPLHYGRRGEADHVVLRRCIEEDLVIVTENARDFRALVGAEEIHPGLIILPCAGRAASAALLAGAIAFLQEHGDPQDVMVNHVLEVAEDGSCRLFSLP